MLYPRNIFAHLFFLKWVIKWVRKMSENLTLARQNKWASKHKISLHSLKLYNKAAKCLLYIIWYRKSNIWPTFHDEFIDRVWRRSSDHVTLLLLSVRKKSGGVRGTRETSTCVANVLTEPKLVAWKGKSALSQFYTITIGSYGDITLSFQRLK